MASILLLCSLIIFSNYVEAYEREDPQSTYYDSDEYEDNRDEDFKSKAEVIGFTTPKSATYEVTEIVIDVPNTSTKPGPVVPNYTTKRTLNTVTPKIRNFTDFGLDFNNDSGSYGSVDHSDNDSNVKAKKNSFTIFHVNAEYDDKPHSHVYHSNDDHRPGFKEYLFGIKKGIINGFNKIFHRHGYGHDHYYRDHFGDHQRKNSEDDDHIFRHDVDREFD